MLSLVDWQMVTDVSIFSLKQFSLLKLLVPEYEGTVILLKVNSIFQSTQRNISEDLDYQKFCKQREEI
jgi:hypothetical protein